MRRNQKRTRGSALLECAVGFGVFLALFSGVWEFGYSFYLYNKLETAVRNGARYASLAAYDNPNGNSFKQRVRQMTVYGDPNATSGTPAAPELTTDRIVVSEVKNGVMPTSVTVEVDNFTLNAFFTKFTLRNKPRVRFDYAGQLLTP
jgi:Flp pilus assembly protein TadG